MISVDEALKLVLGTARNPGYEEVELSDSIGRLLAEDIYSDRPIPPFDRVTMDGIAILYSSYENEKTPFNVEAVGQAGAPQLTLNNSKDCIEIMTVAS